MNTMVGSELLTFKYILMFAPLAPLSARPSMATRVTMLSFCWPTAVTCEREGEKESGGLPEIDGRLLRVEAGMPSGCTRVLT